MADKYKYIHSSVESKTPIDAEYHLPNIEIYNILVFLRSFWMAYLKSFVKKDKQGILVKTKQIRVFTEHKLMVKNHDIMNFNSEFVNNKVIPDLSVSLSEMDHSTLCILPCSLDESMLKGILVRDRALIDDFERQRISTALLPQERLSNFSKLYLFFKRWSLVLKWVVVYGWIDLPNYFRYW